MYKIFIIEDDLTISSELKKQLANWGFQTECADDFRSIIAEFSAFSPHLVLLDITLPFYNGYYWCGEIRKISKVPVVFISSASDNMNIVMAMNMGGDDFIAKPFDFNVLTAKINAILRRTYDFSSGNSNLIEFGGAVLNITDATLYFNEQQIELTKNEFRILLTLMEKKGGVVSRDLLMQRLWETDSFVDENTLTVNINRLRKKLKAAGLDGYIVTKKGLGYAIAEKENRQ